MGRPSPSRVKTAAIVAASIVVAALAIGLYVLTRPAKAVQPQPEPARPEPVPRGPTAIPSGSVAELTASSAAARTERESLLARVRDAHVGHESWDDDGLALLDRVGHEAIAVADEGCYMAGCIGAFTFASEAAYRRAVADVTASSDFAAWTGAKRITSPERLAGGKVVVAILLERPD